MDVKVLFVIFVGSVLINNFTLNQFLGICPFLGISKKVETALGMGMAVIFVMTLAGIMTWCIQILILNPLNLKYLQTIAFILVIAALVQFVEIFMKKAAPALYSALGVYLPLITTNCAVLGLAIMNITRNFNIIETIVHSIGASVGFTLAIVLFASIRERLEIADVPEAFKGFPVALITASLMSIAFMGFQGLV